MNKIYNIYQVSDSTGETLDRIFLAIKAQFYNFECKTIHYSFTRTENQIDKIIQKSKKEENIIILYTIVDNNLAKYLTTECNKKKIPNFEKFNIRFFKIIRKKRKPQTQRPTCFRR